MSIFSSQFFKRDFPAFKPRRRWYSTRGSVFIAIILTPCVTTSRAAEPFHIYGPSPTTNQLWIVKAEPTDDGLSLKAPEKIDLGFGGSTITAHRDKPLLYVAAGGGSAGEVPAVVVTLDAAGAYANHEPVKLKHGSAYLSTDRSGRFLLSADYGGGAVDIYALNTAGAPDLRVGGADEGLKQAHAVLPSLDNRFIYIPYVKGSNALFQYSFDAATGQMTPLEPKDAAPPADTGPRHPAYHPKLPIVYFSNEQHLGVSVYDQQESGQLKIRQICDAVDEGESKEGISSSDIVITPDGRFLFAGIRGHSRAFDWIARYRIQENGEVALLGLTTADKIPWGFALSPDGAFLVVSAFDGATLNAYRIGEEGGLAKVASLACDKNISDIITR